MTSKLNLAQTYLLLVSLLGILIIAPGVVQFESYEARLVLVLVLILAGVAEFATTSVHVNKKSSITFSVSTAVSISVLPFYGPFVAAVATAVSNMFIWAFKPKDGVIWKRSLPQLFFNVGMHSISMFIAGIVFTVLRQQFNQDIILSNTVPWIIAAVINDQLNFWLLMGMLRLQIGPAVAPFNVWKEMRWAMPVNIITSGVGGGVLAYAIANYNWVGVAIFFLPIILSAYAFRLYVRQMQAHMNNLEAIIQERTKERDAFLAVLTHDMKSPLTSIGLYANLLKQHPDVLQSKPQMVDSIIRSHATLTRIVNDIQDLKRLETGNITLDMTLVDLAAVVETVVERLRPFALQKHITMTFRASSSLPIYADAYQIERVVENLVSNAIKYTPEQGEVHVSIYANRQAIIEVEDTGNGIDATDLEKIFDRFYRCKNSEQATGTGLGLAIVKALVEAHKGTVEAKSMVGQGSTFTVALPYTNEPVPHFQTMN